MDNTEGLGMMALYFGAINGVLIGMFKLLERIIDKRESKKREDFVDANMDLHKCNVGSGDLGKLSDLMRQNIDLQKNMIDEQGRLRKDNCDDHLRILRRLDNERSNP